MKVVLMGTPEFAVPIFEKINEVHEVLLVVTQPDKPTGRKKTLTESPVKRAALAMGLEVFQPEKLKNDYQRIIDLNPDLLVTAAYGQMLPKALLDAIPAINVHGSLLPKYRGGAPIQYALFDGCEYTGITIMHMAFQMDSGDIIKQEKIRIEPSDNYGSLSHKLSLLGSQMILGVLEDISNGKAKRVQQNPEDVSFAYTIKRSDEHLDFNQNADAIVNKIRGLSPEPGGYVHFKNQLIKFYRAQISDIIDVEQKPGTVLESFKRLLIQAKDRPVEILEIQVQGKKRMAIKDFLNGQTIIQPGDVFIEGNDIYGT